jgi:sugar lactone lactonase YvrE
MIHLTTNPSPRGLSLLAAGLCAFSLFSCNPDAPLREVSQNQPVTEAGAKKGSKAIPDRIDFTVPSLYPEGISLDDKNNRFLVTSLTTGNIGAVAFDGTYSVFSQEPVPGAAIGLEIDEARKRVLVAVSNPALGNVAQLAVYDLRTGELLQLVNLLEAGGGTTNFANDIALDPQGNAYVTNSFSPVIYKVDPSGNVSVFFENSEFATRPGQFGFNGIAYQNSGFLIVGFSAQNKLIRIPVNNPSAYTEVQLDAPVQGPDGLLVSKDGKQLVVVSNAGGSAAGRVSFFASKDKFQTGTLTENFPTGPVFPTTATGDGKSVYVLYAYLNTLFNPVLPRQNTFSIVKASSGKTRPF